MFFRKVDHCKVSESLTFDNITILIANVITNLCTSLFCFLVNQMNI